MPLGIVGSAADISNGPYRAVRLFLFERSSKTVDAGVTVYVEGTGAVGDSVPVPQDQNWRGSEGEDLANDTFHGRRKYVLTPLPENGSERADRFRQVGQEFPTIPNAAHQRTDLPEDLEHGHFHQSRNIFRIGAYSRRRKGVASTIDVRGAEASNQGGEHEIVFAQAFEEGSDRLDVVRRIKVEEDHIIEVGLHLCQTFNDSVTFSDVVNHFAELARRSTVALGHDEPHMEARRSEKRRERGGVLVRGILVERGGQIEERKHSSLPQGVEDLVHARNRQLAEVADLVEFLVVHGDPNPSRLLWDDHQRARVRRGRVLDQTRR